MAEANSLFSSLPQNIISGVAVAIVNIPFSISIGVASDALPSMGCVTCFWAGLICSIIGGSPVTVVSPTIGLSGIVSDTSLKYGVDVLPLVAMISGFISMIIFFTRMDRLAVFVPGNTMQGFRIAVALIIACNQINSALGLDNFPRHPSFIDNVVENLSHIGETEWQAVVIFVSFCLGQVVLNRLFPSSFWIIFLVGVGILSGYLSDVEGIFPYKIRTLDSRYPGLSLSLFSVPTFQAAWFEPSTFFDLCSEALSISVVAVLQCVISSKILDRITNTRTNQRQEVLGISLATVVSGLFGGIPASSALARTIFHIKCGATTRLSGIISAFSVFALSLIFLPYFKYFPLPCLASILVLAAFNMIDFEELRLVCQSKRHLAIMVVVSVVCITVNPVSGIVIGILLSLGKGAFMEAKAWVLCKIRRGDVILTKFNCNLEIEEKIFSIQSGNKFFDKDMLMCFNSQPVAKSFDQRAQDQVFVSHDAKSGAPAKKTPEIPGDSRYQLVLEYKLGGPMNYLTASTHINRFADLAVDYVLFNLRHVTEIDVDGITALDELVAKLEAHNKYAFFCGIHRRIRKSFEHCEFYEKLLEDKRILTGYKQDKDVFLKDGAPFQHVSDAQMALQNFLLDVHVASNGASSGAKAEGSPGWGADAPNA
eukprot:CAMPEP_0113694668 /NCGR_PEP_ID=MMETSP0038_2-20120614/20435_1 /TAXON_ID=2898 /ORGANISM="Cryptomonas paramecium" /LENGTH=651 /DNA_ID=CAMNT_0000617051 /DNA_START=29 /DNA_END=1984 /DNA_ORIENTATION=- /assembly_acc=CAM_ASM_000170